MLCCTGVYFNEGGFRGRGSVVYSTSVRVVGIDGRGVLPLLLQVGYRCLALHAVGYWRIGMFFCTTAAGY